MNTNADTALRISAVEGEFPDLVELGACRVWKPLSMLWGTVCAS